MQQEFTQSLLESETPILSANAIASLCLDSTGAIQTFDSYSERLFGCSASAVMEQQITTLLPTLPRSALSQNAAPVGQIHHIEARCKDGSRVPVEVTLCRVQAGSHLRWAITIRARRGNANLSINAASRKQGEDDLRRLSLVASKTTNGVVITDAQGRTEWINEGFTRITGYSLAEMQGKKPGSLLQGPETDPATVEIMRAALRNKQGFAVDLINYHKAGYPYWIHVDVTPIFDRHGQIAGNGLIQFVCCILLSW